jgi:hypothetical protein
MKRFFSLIFAVLLMVFLAGCGGGSTGTAGSAQSVGSSAVNGSGSGAGELSADELDWFQNTFFSPDSFRVQFLTSRYASPEEIDLSELLYNGLGDVEPYTPEEYAELEAKGFSAEMDSQRSTTGEINDFLMKNLGVSLDGLNGVGLDQLTYLKEFDAYYSNHNDTNAIVPTIQSGQRTAEGQVILQYYQWDPDAQGEVTLEKQPDGSYHFKSNVPIPA